MVWKLPLGFAVANVVLLPLLFKMGIRNYFLIGAILSLVYSSVGRFIFKVPQETLCTSPLLFQLQALVIWTIVYGIIGFLIEKAKQ